MSKITQGKRPVIGLLCERLIEEWTAGMWTGARDAAHKLGANLICFSGNTLDDPRPESTSANTIYEKANAQEIDGLIIWGSQLAYHTSLDRLKSYCERYQHLPIVNIGLVWDGVPSLLVNNYQGMHDAVSHLIKVHGHQRIAYICGPGHTTESQDRYSAYIDALKENNISLDKNIIVTGKDMEDLYSHNMDTGEIGVHILLDKRGILPGKDIDAIVGRNDGTCWFALKELQARGIHVPDDVAMVGFDDLEESRFIFPPLTTAQQSFYDQGWRGVEMLLAKLRGEKVLNQVLLPMKLSIRQSCGCQEYQITQTVAKPTVTAKQENIEDILEREKLIEEITQVTESTVDLDEKEANQLIQLMEAFQQDLAHSSNINKKTPNNFLTTLNEILQQADTNILAWQNTLSALRQYTLNHIGGNTLQFAENIWHQAHLSISEFAQRAQAYQAFHRARQTKKLCELSQGLITSFDIQKLMNVLEYGLRNLEIPSAYVILYDESKSQTTSSRLLLAYSENKRIVLNPGGLIFSSNQLLPEGMLPEKPCSFVAEPLYFEEAPLGYVLFEVGPKDGTTYHVLSGQLRGALQGALLVEKVKERATQLDTAAKISSVTSSILEPQNLIQKTVELVCERFGLNYVGLFLIDSSGQWAELQASASKPGQETLIQENKSAINDESMIGWCIANKQPRIEINDGKDVNDIESSSSSATHSEMVLPLISQDEAIGALTIQSTRSSAFSQENLLVFQTMAEQLANSIEKARLYKQSQLRAIELSQARKTAEESRWEAERAKARAEKEKQKAEKANKELALSSKYKSEFLANMSHELRTPLNSMLILASILARNEENNLTQEQLKSIQVIHSGGSDLLSLINEILDLAKVEAGKMEFRFAPMSWRSLITNMHNQFDHIASDKGLNFITTIEENVPNEIITDQQRVEQIIKNLLSNAFKFTKQGNVHIHIHRPAASQTSKIIKKKATHKNFIAVNVTDTGIGMNPEQQKKVFEAFQQAEDTIAHQYGGTGLGLAITRELSIRLGGQVTLQSEPDKGTTFTIYLPLEETETPEPASEKTTSDKSKTLQSTTPLPSQSSSKDTLQDYHDPLIKEKQPRLHDSPDNESVLADKQILIVDDDARNAFALSKLLNRKKAKTHIVPNAYKALALLDKKNEIDLILTDIMMPNMDGYELIKAIREQNRYQKMPIIALTAKAMKGDREKCLEAGANDYLSKPIDPEQLLSMLKEWLGKE